MAIIQYIRSHILPSKVAQLLIQTALKWQRDDCHSMSATLAYHALFSLFPLLLIALSVAGSWVEPGTEAFQSIEEGVKQFLPPAVHSIIRETVIALNESSTGAGLIGTGLLLHSATTVFNVLGTSVNRIWRTTDDEPPAPKPIHRTILSMLLHQLFSFLMVIGTGLLLLLSLVFNIVFRIVLTVVAIFEERITFVEIDELQIARALQVSSSLLLLAIVTCILFKVLPLTYVAWRDIWPGALLTSLTLVGLQQLVSNSVISIGSNYLSYGVVGSVMILMVWLHLTCQIFFAGCEFCYVYATLFGSRRHQSSMKKDYNSAT